ncbi:NAD(P)/FAD-dependent oxidoreductase [uncultured Secundilactobacillus sp.]|uniref:NAD(P)/FAD-dependent oxidoreductase n=1 Tax=uncultured Secundilactobacillus sp. TaxID=2813935 RepID=UPI00258E9C4E|nr:NAD(P)/FAD-dependent oxidoreductase [uncultured Secundilactobacillus sp.]
METTYDITIIGGGPAGIFAGFYAGLREAKAQLIESLPDLGGQVQALYPEKKILDVAGFPAIRGQQLIQQQITQLNDFPIEIKTNQAVTDIVRTATGFEVVSPVETTHTKTVIIAVGNGSFSPRRLAIENAADLENKHLFYSVSDLSHFANKRVIIAGGGDAALDQAMMLEEVATSVTLVHRRDTFRALEHSVSRLAASDVNVMTPYLIKTVTEKDGELEVGLKKMRTDDPLVVQTVDDVVVSYGFTSDHKVVDGWHLDLDAEHHLFKVDSTMLTSEPGIYAIGDGVTYAGKQALIASGYGEAPIAVNAAMNQLYPDRRGPVHSTSLSKD